MSGNIVPFRAPPDGAKWARERAHDGRFLVCPHCGQHEFAVVARWVDKDPFVAALVCVSCDTLREAKVLNGLVEPLHTVG